ncbi:hypothetical protein HPP92_004270 [Vanilla planifolia]|uniref:Uncharacterized protein n=1 Tax=Vanilla planifolia TaxID=51239 RepID=A0A835RWK5_VANPL|nr:hypothetical protein HPP92_004270 [Vanilla planifolia]
MEFAVAAWAVEGEPSPSYVGSAEEIWVRSLHGLCKTFSGQKKRSGLQTAWDSSKVIYKVASWTATAIRKPGRLWPEAESLIPPSSDALANSSCNTEIDFKLNNPSL